MPKLKISIPESSYILQATQRIYHSPGIQVELEHSLWTISEWESKWKLPFIYTENKPPESISDYIRIMANTDLTDLQLLSIEKEDIARINNYMNDSMTATKFYNNKKPNNSYGKVVTSEEIYYRMSYYGIPFEAEHWHLNRLLTLLEICSINSEKPRKMTQREIYEQNNALNKVRKARR